MSGIVGIVRRDGAPVEQELLRELTHFLAFRGPDGSNVWCQGVVGFGHSMLQTTRESLYERQPANLDSRFWIIADARIDCREELLSALAEAGHECEANAPDSELILQAYAAWGEDCLDKLRGDFAFAIWDVLRKSLFCARDHFGIKPFYYAAWDDLFIFANTLNCLRIHPRVSSELNEAAIGDFLLFGLNYDLAATTFRDIRRLPPAHFLRMSFAGIEVRRYWSPPTNGRIRYTSADEYVEHFDSIFRAAVTDRLRTDRAGILLSGGLDSGAIAATARDVSRNSEATALRAYTVTFDSLFSDQEGRYAKETAEFLHIPIQCLPFDHRKLFDRWSDPDGTPPEPAESAFFAGCLDQFRTIAKNCRVALSGEGSDNLMLFEMAPYLRHLWRERDHARLVRDGLHYLWIRPFPWRGIRQRFNRLLDSNPKASVVPRWIAPDFARRTSLEERWREFAEPGESFAHSVLPKAHASLALPQWSHLFEGDDPGTTRSPVEVRYPFLDLRIVNYLLALPPFPWFFEKKLLRQTMAGRLPESVRLRRKTPLAGDPVSQLLQKPESAWLNHVTWDDQVARFIDVSRLLPDAQNKRTSRRDVYIRAHCLNFWLRSATGVQYKLLHAEARNG